MTERGYAEMAASLRRACAGGRRAARARARGRLSLEALSGSVAALMPALTAESPPAEPDAVPVHPLAEEAAERLAPWWPGVGSAQRA